MRKLEYAWRTDSVSHGSHPMDLPEIGGPERKKSRSTRQRRV